jgi:RimJ/RimL family protein N-acetyltransferase
MKIPPREFKTPDGRVYAVRSARPREAGKVLDHAWHVRAEPEVSVEDQDEFRCDVDQLRGILKTALEADNGFFLAAAAGDDVVATLSVAGGRHGKVRHVGEIGVSVRAGWRRRGVGRRLLEVAIEHARAAPALRRLSLEVFARNTAAIRLYESFGFVHEGRRRGHVRIGDRDEDVLLMGLLLEDPG